ncbi:MAG: SNF2-related protein [Aeromicrobium erythreum]
MTEGFVVTTYATLRRDAADLADVETGWGVVVADEAQYVKNVRSAAAKALRSIPTPVRLALTGTPVENGLTELWSILDWTTPGAARRARGVPTPMVATDRARSGPRPAPASCRASSARSCSGAARATRASRPSCLRRPRPTTGCT